MGDPSPYLYSSPPGKPAIQCTRVRHSPGLETVGARNDPRPARPRLGRPLAASIAHDSPKARLREVDGAHKEAGDGAVVRSRVLVKDAVDGALVDVVVERLLTALCPPPHPGRALFSFGCCGRLSASSPHAQSGGSGRRRCAACAAAFVKG